MKALPLPGIASTSVFSLCLSGTTDGDLHARLSAIAPRQASTAGVYDTNARNERLDLMQRVTGVGDVDKEELKALYSHMNATRGTARAVYDEIRNSAPNRKCPLCGVGTVAVLDHHLPKSKYPDLAILPANLVPVCHFCNDTKGARYPRNASQQTLHPYYDARLLMSRWVRATISVGSPVVVTYFAAPPSTWTNIDKKRVQRHFEICGIGTVFSSNANDELSLIKHRLLALSQRGGSAAVVAHLVEQAAIYATRPNCWQLSMYEVLASDCWFVGGGFNSIA